MANLVSNHDQLLKKYKNQPKAAILEAEAKNAKSRQTSASKKAQAERYKFNSHPVKGFPRKEQKVSDIEFKLFAPYQSKVAVRGDFSDWKEVEMQKDEEGYFRTCLELADGDYEYQFCIISNSPWHLDKWIYVTDPLATDINDQNNDNAVLHIRKEQNVVDEYQWQHDDKNLPADDELVIYELHVGDFAGTFQGVVEKLDYLSGIGVNAIELMPVAEFPGDQGWGYNPKHFFAVENAYGCSADLKQLIDECHARGIRVILDLVANHAHQDTPLAQIDHNYWFAEHNIDEMQFGPKFNYSHLDDNLEIYPARKFMNEVAFYWASEFHLDGIRFDATALVNNFDFLDWLSDCLKASSGGKPFYLIAEHIPIDPAVVGLEGPMDGLWHDYFYFQMTANLREREFEGWQPFDWERTQAAIEPARAGIIGATAAVQYLSNHDHNRLMYELGTAEVLDEKAFRKIKLGMAVTMTSVGVPMIWMGDEFGEFSDKSMEVRPLQWELLQNEANADLLHYVKGLIYLRKTTMALKTENIEFIYCDEENKVLAWKRWNDEGSQVLVVANFSDNFLGDYTLTELAEDGKWHEYTHDYDITIEGGVLKDNLAESKCKIYIKQ